MDAALSSLADELEPATLLAEVQRVWAATVGSSIAAQAEPASERGGVITVACAASVWAQELDLISPQIIERLNAAVGSNAVRRLRCVAVGHASRGA